METSISAGRSGSPCLASAGGGLLSTVGLSGAVRGEFLGGAGGFS
jgi:hypothetical protein